MPVRKDINFNSGFTGCNDRMAILKNETVPRKLEDFTEINPTEISTDMFVYVDDGEAKKIRLGNIINTTASQADWAEEDKSSYSYIRNKPADLALDKDVTSLYNIGGVKAGQIFKKGTSLNDIVLSMLSFSDEESGLRFGLLDTLPEHWTSDFIEQHLVPENEITYDYMLENGLSIKFNTNGQPKFYVLAVPYNLNISVDSVVQGDLDLAFRYFKGLGYDEDLNGNKEVIWDICLPTNRTFPDTSATAEDYNKDDFAPVSGEYKITYMFKDGD